MVCGPCLRRMPWLRGHRCPRCALPRHRAGCPAAGSAFDRAWAPLAYEGTARDLVRALKFDGALPVAGLMAAHMAANLPLDLRAPPEDLRRPREGVPPEGSRPAEAPSRRAAFGIVPAPPHRGRLRRRGFDPAALLAAGLAARAGLALAPCLRRTDRGRRQGGAGRGAPAGGGGGAGAAPRGPPPGGGGGAA